jgi:hypothetical protein
VLTLKWAGAEAVCPFLDLFAIMPEACQSQPSAPPGRAWSSIPPAAAVIPSGVHCSPVQYSPVRSRQCWVPSREVCGWVRGHIDLIDAIPSGLLHVIPSSATPNPSRLWLRDVACVAENGRRDGGADCDLSRSPFTGLRHAVWTTCCVQQANTPSSAPHATA